MKSRWMRIYAVEILAVNQLAIACLANAPEDPLAVVERIRGQMSEGAQTQGFPGLDAASSDLASAELEDAIDRLMEMVSGQINVVLERRKTRPAGS